MDFTITFNQAMALIIGTGILVATLALFGWHNRDKKPKEEFTGELE